MRSDTPEAPVDRLETNSVTSDRHEDRNLLCQLPDDFEKAVTITRTAPQLEVGKRLSERQLSSTGTKRLRMKSLAEHQTDDVQLCQVFTA